MKNVIISNPTSDQHHLLNRYYNWVTHPMCLYSSNKKIANFDFTLAIDSYDKFISNICKITQKPLIGCERFEKSTQIALLNNGGINTPYTTKFFSSEKTSFRNIEDILSSFEEDELIVIKEEDGARGIGQALGKRENILNFIVHGEVDNLRFGNYDQYNQKKIKIKNENFLPIEENDSYQRLKNNTNILFQKYIKNTTEFRIIYFYDEPFIIIKRDEDENGSWQKNNQVTKNAKLITSHNLITKDIENKLRHFFDKLNSPYFSIDLYYDHDMSTWGIYEFQMEFGHKNIPINMLIERSYNSIEKLIQKVL